MTGRRRIEIGLCLLFAGCAARQVPTNDLPEREVRGHYTTDAGGSWFRPCGAAEADPAWWVTFTGASVEQAERERALGRLLPGTSTLVRFRTAVATDGRVGPQGPGAPGLLRIARLMAPATVGLAAVQVNIFLSSRFASHDPGAVSWLNYAFRILYLPIGVFGVAAGNRRRHR